MKKTTLFPLCALFLAHFSCSRQKEQISVRIDGWGDDTVVVEYFSTLTKETGRDTLLARGGRFGYTLPLTDSLVQVLIFREADKVNGSFLPMSRRILTLLSLPDERLKISGRVRSDAALEYTVRGSAPAEDLAALRAETLPIEIRRDSNEFVLNEVYGKDSIEEANRFARRRELNVEIRTVEREHILTHPDRLSSAFFMLMQPLDSLPTYYALLSDGVKNGIMKPELDALMQHFAEYQEYQKNKMKEWIGQPAPDFTLTGIDGGLFTLSEYDTRGKYTVLDFWGSWCGPCIAGIPEMKKQYEQYRNRLELIGIACKDKETAWKAAVAEHGLPWIQVINDETSAESNVAVRYAVGAYPTKIILSPDKTILFTFVGEGRDFYEKLDELLK